MYKEPYNYQKVDEFIDWAAELSKNTDKETAFKTISTAIENCEARYLNDFVGALNFVPCEAVLDWIENNTSRIVNISDSWGHVTASIGVTWQRIEKWLDLGRPLSLIALDAALYCTTVDKRLNQSPMMRELNPRFADNPNTEQIAMRLERFLLSDNVPRTQLSVKKIIDNIFDARYRSGL